MEVMHEHKMPDMPKPDLVKMLNLCAALPGITDEVTPVMAWSAILSHPKCEDMTKDDFSKLKDDLKGKVRCYGFGAVLEDFEVKDAIIRVLNENGPIQLYGTMEWTETSVK